MYNSIKNYKFILINLQEKNFKGLIKVVESILKNIMLPNSNRIDYKIQTNESIDRTFKEYAKTISESIHKLNSFTDNLEGKVNMLLKVQENQFVVSYQNHMSKIREELKQMDKKLIQYQQKIQYYQNEGRLSHYVKKVNFMEFQQLKLYQQIINKDKTIKSLQSQVDLLKKMQKKSDEQIKKIFRKKVEEQTQISIDKEKQQSLIQYSSQTNIEKNQISNNNLSSIETFATQLPSHHYRKEKLIKSHSRDRKVDSVLLQTEHKSSMIYQSQNFGVLTQEERQSMIQQEEMKNHRVPKLLKQINLLKSQNKKLLLYNSKYANSLSQLGQFFLNTVDDLKKTMAQKRKIKNDIKFEDFCKQDKLVLISTLVSNENVLSILYDNIFRPCIDKNRVQSVLEKSYGAKDHFKAKSRKKIEEVMSRPGQNILLSERLPLPLIKNKRLIL